MCCLRQQGPCSVAVFVSEMSVLPELTGIALSLEWCLSKEDADSKASMDLLRSMQLALMTLQAPCTAAPCVCGPPNQSAGSKWSSHAAGQSQGLCGIVFHHSLTDLVRSQLWAGRRRSPTATGRHEELPHRVVIRHRRPGHSESPIGTCTTNDCSLSAIGTGYGTGLMADLNRRGLLITVGF